MNVPRLVGLTVITFLTVAAVVDVVYLAIGMGPTVKAGRYVPTE